MNRIKHFMILALALTLSLGAWAQTHTVTWDGDALQSVDVASYEAVNTQTIDGITVTANSGYFKNYPESGGVIATAYLGSTNGLVFSSTVNILSIEVNTSSTNSTFAGSTGSATSHTYTLSPASTQFVLNSPDQWYGITSIVFTLDGDPNAPAAPDPYAPALDETTGHWNFLMPGSNKVVKAVLYDSIVLGPHVELYDADPAFAAGDIYTRGDSTIYYYDTNNHHSFYLRADEQADSKYFGYWSDLDPTDSYYTDRTYRRVSTGSFTCGQRFTAAYLNNYTLTLNPSAGGTLSVLLGDGIIDASARIYTLTFTGFNNGNMNTSVQVNASEFPVTLTHINGNEIGGDNLWNDFAWVNSADASNDDGKMNCSVYNDYHNFSITISGAFDGTANIHVDGANGDWGGEARDISVSCVLTTNDITYSVMEGLTVNVTATPDSAHYLASIDGHDTVGNYATGYSFVMPSSDKDLLAVFNAKPTLTLTQTDGGTLEAIVPQGGGEETLLTTVTATGQTDYSQTTEGIVTVTLDNLTGYNYIWGWLYSGSVTVEAAQGYTITRCVFKQNPSSTPNRVLVDDLAPFTATMVGNNDGGTDVSATTTHGDEIGDDFMAGISSIEVYGYQNVAANVTPIANTNTYIIDYGTPVTVVATPDAQHYLVSFSDDDPATERNSNIAVEKTYDSVVADIPLTANFQAKPTLTLTANAGGTLTLDGMVEPTPATATIEFAGNNNTVTVSNVTLPHTFSCSYATENGELDQIIKSLYEISSGYNQPSQPPTASGNDNVTAGRNYNNHFITISAPFDGTAAVTGGGYWKTSGEETEFEYNLTITILSSTPGTPGLPAGVIARNGDTFTVDYGTEVTVTATPDATHYLATLGGVTMGSNTAKDTTFAVTVPTNLDANFAPKPTLTLAHNESWGSVTLGGMVEPGATGTTFTVPGAWQSGETPLSTSDFPGFVPVSQEQALSWQAPASGNYRLFYKYEGGYWYYININNGTFGTPNYGDFYRFNIYNIQNNGRTIVYTTGAIPGGMPAGVAQLTDNTYRVDYGTTLTVQADAAELHHVANWVNEESVAYPADSITYSDYFVTTPEPLFPAHSTLRLTVTADATAKAVFGINSYDVTASVAPTTDERGTVRIASTDVQGAAQVSDSLATVTATAQGGSTSTLTAYPAWGYHFVEWQNQNGTQVSTDNPLAVTSAVDTALVAVFDTTKAELAWSDESFTGYTLIDFNNWAPTLTNSHNVEVRYGCVEGTLNVDAQSGIVGIEVAYGFIPTTVGTYHIYAVHDLSQEYFYDSVVYTLTVERGTIVSLSQNIETGGTAVFADQDSQPTLTHYYASGTMAFVAHGHTVDLVAEPAEGYHFTAWQEGDLISGYTDIATSLEHTYTVPDATTIGLKAVFDTNVYNVTIVNDHDTLTDLAMGVDTVYRMKHFLDQPLTAEAKFGYYFVQWADSVTDNPRMVNVTGDTAFRAQYDRRTFYVTVVVDTARAHGSGTRICRYLDYFPITITPKHGYHFVQWSDGNTQNPRYVTCTGNATYSAQMAPDQFTVSGSANQNLGTISGLGNHDYMSTATLTATPNHGYRFDHWNDGVTANPRSVVVTKDTAFEAFFVIGQYTVTAASANTTMGSAAGTATVNYLDTVQISATANAHYHFVKWNDNNTQNPRKVVATNNVTYTAQFAADNYTVTGLADQGMGSVTGSGSYAYLSNATLTAVPACGYLFDHWSNDSTATTITVKVTGPTTLTAYFRPAVVDTVTVTVHDTTVVTNTVIVHDTTYVDIHDSVDVTVYVHDTTTVEVPVYVHDTTMVEVLVHDTTTVEVPVYVHDTTMVEVPVYVHDTTYIDIHDSVDVTVYVYVHDTTTVEVPVYMHDTTTVEVPVYVHDTTTVTVEVPVYVHDTTTVTVEVPVYVYDTTTVEVPVYVYDTTTIEVPVHDTTTVTEYIVDTLWLTEYIHDTVWQIKYIYDTVYIHDTIFVGIDDVDALDAKIYANNGQIVVEGADGNKVVLYDVTGRILAKKQDEFAPLRFDIPASGTYLVKIGNHAARRIVMIR